MNNLTGNQTAVDHVVALPYPGRGHINPMMNLCKLLVSKTTHQIIITFVVTEEWLGFIGSQSKPPNIHFATIPNVIPSELVRSADFDGFVEAVATKLEAPFEQLLDRINKPPVRLIIADTHVRCAISVGNRRDIPVASFWPMSATMFSLLDHFDLLVQNKDYPIDPSERGDELVDYIPGISSTRLTDLPTCFNELSQQVLDLALEFVSFVHKTQYLLFSSIYELEPQVIDVIKSKFPFPVYSIGPTIPYFNLALTNLNDHDDYYLQWLDAQPKGSVLYVSLGSFLSVSKAQMDEIVDGINKSGVRFLWVSRGKTLPCGDMGLVVPWCDQLKVLCHPSIGGFWTHCGWNSTIEAVYAGVPMLAFPIFWDQISNRKLIVQDWKNGWSVKRAHWSENLVMGDEIAELVNKFMNLESEERKEMLKRARDVQELCRRATTINGSSNANLDSFISAAIFQTCEH